MFPQAQTITQNNILELLAKALSERPTEMVQKTASGSPEGPYYHGPGGLFGVRGLTRQVISTFTQITGSLGEVIPIQSSADIVPLFPYITGFIRSDTQEKNGICDDPEEAGQMKTCIGTTVFGRKEFRTRELEVNRIGQKINRGEFFDLQVVNSPLVNEMGGLMQNFFKLGSQASILQGQEMVARFLEVAVAFQRWYCPKVYDGNPANNRSGGGYKEFMGLDMLIGTNKVDAQTGQACPSLYSDVKSFGYNRVDAADSATTPDIYRTLSTMMYILETRATQNNLAPVQFALVMRSQLFWELTRFWPIKYNTEMGYLSQAGLDNVFLESIRMRDSMRNEQYLLINSKRYRVILDDCIAEENRSTSGNNPNMAIGGFASDIYIVPLTARGGTVRTLYWEYYDYQNDVLPQVSGLPNWFWSDNGAFLWTMDVPKLWCIRAAAKTEPRLILRTPQLAGRLTDVQYVPLQHTNDPLPSQMYHVNGGVSTGRPLASPYYEGNLSGPGIPS